MCGQIVIITNFRYHFSQMPKTLVAQGIRGFFKKQYETNPNGKLYGHIEYKSVPRNYILKVIKKLYMPTCRCMSRRGKFKFNFERRKTL